MSIKWRATEDQRGNRMVQEPLNRPNFSGEAGANSTGLIMAAGLGI